MVAMQNRFSAEANRVLNWTQVEAERLGNEQVEPEHLLLGLLEDKQGTAIKILHGMEINLESLKNELLESISQLTRADDNSPELSQDAQKVLDFGLESANILQSRKVGTEHLLIGLIRHMGSKVYPMLRRAGVTYNNILRDLKTSPPEITITASSQKFDYGVQNQEDLSLLDIIQMISFSFWGMVIIMIGSGMAAYFRWVDPGIAVFFFVTMGWIISVSLHEFGHALVAYWGGDKSVINKGYLTLNPLKYSHGTLSIIFPIIILIMGGIGLPGGAVYINMAAISQKKMRALVSAAGPIMTGLFALFLVVFISIGTNSENFLSHLEFWAGVSFLAFLQITAFVFNMIPLPPLDGFGILRPFLPEQLVRLLLSIGRYTFLMIMFLFLSNNPIRDFFWQFISRLIEIANLNGSLVGGGIDLFRFWN